MKIGPDISSIGALIGNPARANMLAALMSGEALTAGELANVAGVAAPTASGHLSLLVEGGLLIAEKQRRHRYYRLAGPDVAGAIEALMHLGSETPRTSMRVGPKDPQLRHARVCYDHLAGEMGVALFARLSATGTIGLDGEGIAVTDYGATRLAEFGIDLADLRRAKRPVCRSCLDWSERRPHLAGALGARLLTRFYELRWAHRIERTRIVKFTPKGEAQFASLFG